MSALNPQLERLGLELLQALFRQNPWATERLSGFAGKTVALELSGAFPALPRIIAFWLPATWPELPVLRIARDGYLERAARSEALPLRAVDVRLRLLGSPALLEALRSRNPQAWLSHLRIEGDVLLAAALGEVLSELSIDLGAFFAPFLGDILAQRIDEQGRKCFESLRSRLAH